MSASRTPWIYRKTGDPLDGLRLSAIEKVNGIWRGISMNMGDYNGPLAEGTDAGIILRGTVGTSLITNAGVASRTKPGYIRITSSATEDDNLVLEFPNRFIYEVGSQVVCFMKFALSDANDGEFAFGLMTPGLTDFVATQPVEGIFFEKAETAVDLDFSIRDASTSTTDTTFSNSTLLADAVYKVVGFVVDALGNITPYYGNSLTTLTAGTVVAAGTANLPDDAGDELAFTLVFETGAATANYVDVEYLLCMQTV